MPFLLGKLIEKNEDNLEYKNEDKYYGPIATGNSADSYTEIGFKEFEDFWE